MRKSTVALAAGLALIELLVFPPADAIGDAENRNRADRFGVPRPTRSRATRRSTQP